MAIFVLLLIVSSLNSGQVSSAQLSDCIRHKHTILDLVSLKCTKCTNNTVSSSNGLICECSGDSLSADGVCSRCRTGEKLSQDRTTCVNCGKSHCDCNSTSILVYRYTNGALLPEAECVECIERTVPDTEKNACVPCTTIECKCAQNASFCPNPAIRFSSLIGQQKSAYIERRLPDAYASCQREEFSACQELLNLCVLQNYATIPDNACAHYNEISSNVMRNKLYSIIPLSTNTIKSMGGPGQIFRFENSVHGHLEYFVAKYSINGTVLSYLPIVESKIISCPLSVRNLKTAFTFGVKFSIGCEVEFEEIQPHDGYFYELFLHYTSEFDNGTSIRQIQPVYVVSELLNSGITFTDDEQESWIYTKRFFILDWQSIRENNSSYFLRFARHLEFKIFLENSRDGKISQPFVKIGYTQFSNSGQPIHPLGFAFMISYDHDPFRHDKDMEITMAVLCSLSVLWAALRAYSWGRRAGKQLADASTIVQFVLSGFSVLGDVFLLVTTVMACWLTLAYKSQNYVYYQLLNPYQQTILMIYVSVATGLKFISYLHVNVKLMMTETFFIDWERPKVLNENNTQKPPTVDAVKGKRVNPPVIWRTYLVANEWNELQNYRKTSIGIQVLAMMFFMDFLRWINFAVVRPGFSTDSDFLGSQMAMETKWAVIMFVYLGFGFLQWAVSVLIVERIILDPFHNFIDLCSIANISVLALTHPLNGFYIHGRSVHGRADTDMREMNDFLQRERDNLCGFRGLEPGSELQTYSLSLPLLFRTQFDQIKKGINPPPNIVRLSGTDASTVKISAIAKTHAHLNTYLQELIDHSLDAVDYTIRDRTMVEGILDIELDDTTQIGSFIRDLSEVGYSECFLYGHEWSAMSFEALLFSLSYILFGSFSLSSIITYLTSHSVRTIASTLFTNHLMRSSCVDHRFLI